ncbi:MAG: hypothetical protein FD179_1833 [Erysipelotrichaceae bacterium]|nr:MAG: hypothetical protein FD179_1833 [Erysipelotrichaceae bacterium]
MKSTSFKNHRYLRAEELIRRSSIFNNDIGGGIFKGKPYPFVLHDNNNNLYALSSSEILQYFYKNRIAWWNGRLTNHTLSSQVACLNHLYPIRDDKAAVLSIVQNICADIVDLERITTDTFKPAYIQFESVSDTDHLNELTSTRGSNCTSVDALILGVHKDGRRILFPIEWKYVEVYGNDNKARGDKGTTRISRYTNLINNSIQLQSTTHDIYYFEPFYQLMRQTLWAEQMIACRNTETIRVDDFIHVHVIPSENKELLNKIYPCSGQEMENTWRSCLKDQSKYMIVTPKALLSPISKSQYQTLIDYLETRYW